MKNKREGKSKPTLVIGIDGTEANVPRRVGVNQFAFHVLWGIYKLRKTNPRYCRGQYRIFLPQKPLADLPPQTAWWQYEVFGPPAFWTWTGLPKRLFLGRPKPDVLYSPSHYGPGFSPVPFVVSIMDLGYLRYSDQFTKKDFLQLRYWTSWSARKARKIITISEFSKKDIINTFKIKPDKIIVAHPGFKKKIASKGTPISSLSSLRKKYRLEDNYLLFLGTLKPSKNIEGLIKAFHLLVNKKGVSDLTLVIAGKKGWLYENIYTLVKKLKLENQVVFTGFVADKDVPTLIAGAKIFVLPSFWEGFGIPVLEAMDAGTPVVCSRAGSLPEITGRAAVLVNPNKVEDIARGIEKVLANPELRRQLIKNGKAQKRMFSWEKCSKIILDTLLKIAKS